MKILKILLISVAILLSKQGLAQVTFHIGQSSDNSFTKGEAAQLVYTNPTSDTKESSSLTQGFLDLGYSFNSRLGKLSITANGELHKNTLIDKEQDTRQWGGTFDLKKTFKDKNGVAVSLLNPTISIKHSNDNIKNEQGMQYIFGATYYPSQGATSDHMSIKNIITPDAYWSVFNNALGFSTNYNLGAAFANIETKPLSFIQGNFSLDGYLLPRLFDRLIDNHRLIFGSYSYNGRLEMRNDTNKDLDRLQKFGIGLDISLLKLAKIFNSDAKSDNNKFTIKNEWISGADPLKGLEKQKYSQMTFNVLVNF